MTDMDTKGKPGVYPSAGTVQDCERDGHCFHPGTAVGSLWCCKCYQYRYPARNAPIPFSNSLRRWKCFPERK